MEVVSHMLTWKHGGATRENYVSEEIPPDVDVTLPDRVEGRFMDPNRLHS